VQTRANAVKFAHQSLCNPKISTLLKATQKGFLKGHPNMTKKLILKNLNPSPTTAKGHMKRPHYGIKSTNPKPLKITPLHIPIISTAPPQPAAQIQPPVLPLFPEVPIYPRPAYRTPTGPNLILNDDDKSIANNWGGGHFLTKTVALYTTTSRDCSPSCCMTKSCASSYFTITSPTPSSRL
jgi:hypothetical protein